MGIEDKKRPNKPHEIDGSKERNSNKASKGVMSKIKGHVVKLFGIGSMVGAGLLVPHVQDIEVQSLIHSAQQENDVLRQKKNAIDTIAYLLPQVRELEVEINGVSYVTERLEGKGLDAKLYVKGQESPIKLKNVRNFGMYMKLHNLTPGSKITLRHPGHTN